MKGPKQQSMFSHSRELLSAIKGSVLPSLPTTSVDTLTAFAWLLVTSMDLWYQLQLRHSSLCLYHKSLRLLLPDPSTRNFPSLFRHLSDRMREPALPRYSFNLVTFSDCISISGHTCDIRNQTLIYMIEETQFNRNSKKIYDTFIVKKKLLNLSHNQATSDHRASF